MFTFRPPTERQFQRAKADIILSSGECHSLLFHRGALWNAMAPEAGQTILGSLIGSLKPDRLPCPHPAPWRTLRAWINRGDPLGANRVAGPRDASRQGQANESRRD